MKSIHDIRQDNLRQLIDTRFNGSQTQFAKEVGLGQPSFVSRLLTAREPTRKNIGNRLARRVEAALGLSPNYLDTPSFELERPRYENDPPRAGNLDLPLGTTLAVHSRPRDAPTVLAPQEDANRGVRLLSAAELGQFASIASVYEARPTGGTFAVRSSAATAQALALRLADDSMGERFPAGSIVVIVDSQARQSNDFVVAALPGTATAVMRQWVDAAGRQFLVPLNRAYQATEVTRDYPVLGVVIEAVLFFPSPPQSSPQAPGVPAS